MKSLYKFILMSMTELKFCKSILIDQGAGYEKN